MEWNRIEYFYLTNHAYIMKKNNIYDDLSTQGKTITQLDEG